MADEEQEDGEAKPKSKLPLIIGAVVLLLAVAGGGALMLMGGEQETEEPAEVVEVPQEYAMLQLEPFYVNLSETSNYLKLVMSIQYNKTMLDTILTGPAEEGAAPADHSMAGKSAEDFFNEKRPILRDTILQLLSSRTLKDVLSLEGKELMKEELLEVLNESLEFEDEVFVRVLFMDFLVQ